MGGAYYIMMVNVAVGAVLLVGFSAFWIYQPKRKAPLFLALATMLFLGSGGLELSAPFIADSNPSLFRFILYTINFSAGILMGTGVAIHYRLDPHWKLTGAGFLMALVLTYLVLDMPRQSVLRMTVNQLPLVCAIGIAAWRVANVKDKNFLDRALVAALAVFAINMASRPVILALYGSMGANSAEFHKSEYAMATNLSLAMITMATATILMLVLVADLVRDLAQKSQRDPLTGVFNRRGLNVKLANNGISAEHGMQPVSVVVADLDHFKTINDTYGHNAGDQVIKRFAMLLEAAAGGQHIVARMGGEEFIVVLPACDTSMARLFAEGVRTVFAESELPGMEEHKVSASFGVAGWRRGEPLDNAIKAADGALYKAKQDGRNCVHMAGTTREAGQKTA